MNNCGKIISAICSGDELIKNQAFTDYFDLTREFVEKNNTVNNTKVSSKYIFFDCLGILNMKFTASYKRNTLSEKSIVSLPFENVLYFLTRELFVSEITKIINRKKRKLFVLKDKYSITETFIIDEIDFLENEFREVIDNRTKELSLLHNVVNGGSMDKFTEVYFDLAINIINKSKSAVEKLNDHEIEEYAKDIFGEATLKLFTLILEGNYVYEAKISSFIYWPMFNKWTKISKDIGIYFDDNIIDKLPDDEKLYYNDNLEEEELKLFIKENFAKLNKKEREILWLKEIEGYSYQEIKEKLNLDEEINYLKQMKLRGKRNLANKMAEDRRLKELLN